MTEITRFLKEWLDYYRTIDLGVHSRLQETHFFLEYRIYLTADILSGAACFIQRRCHETGKGIFELASELRYDNKIRGLNKIRRRGRIHPDYIAHIRLLYQRNIFQIASRVDDFQQHQHDGIFYRKRLYLRRECLKRYFPNENIDHIVEQLADQGVLETGKESRTKQISRLKGALTFLCIEDGLPVIPHLQPKKLYILLLGGERLCKKMFFNWRQQHG